MADHILIEKSGGVLSLTMNRPDKKNALTRSMYQSLGDAIDQAAFDKDDRSILSSAARPGRRSVRRRRRWMRGG